MTDPYPFFPLRRLLRIIARASMALLCVLLGAGALAMMMGWWP
jgi:hypothetical protein